jgi:(R,R)-butanediol dehydrogenase/meso-butanediol dehydrogenase/diacetyl reductase
MEGFELALQACADAVCKRGVVMQASLHPGERKSPGSTWSTRTYKNIGLQGSWTSPGPAMPPRHATDRLWPDSSSHGGDKDGFTDGAIAESINALLDPEGNHLKILIDIKL